MGLQKKEKQNLFQHMLKNNMNGLYKNLTGLIILILLLSFAIFFVYKSINQDEIIKNNQRIADSLRIEVLHFNRKYDSLQIVANKLDTLIQNQEIKVVKLKEKFVIYKSEEIKNPTEAYIYINKFIQE